MSGSEVLDLLPLNRKADTTMQPIQADRRRASRLIQLLFVGPIILLLIATIGFLLFQFVSAAKVKSHIAKLRADHQLVDNASLEMWFFRHSSQETSDSWNELINVPISRHQDPVIALFQDPDVEASNTTDNNTTILNREHDWIFKWPRDWSDEPRVADYLKRMQPVLQRLAEIPEQKQPVWQPVSFDGWATSYNALFDLSFISQLINWELQYALFHQDPDRALRALQIMRKANAAFDWRLGETSQLIYVSRFDQYLLSIRRTLRTGLWNQEQLAELQKQLRVEIGIEERWAQVISVDRALLLAELDGPKTHSPFLFDFQGNGMMIALTQIPSWQSYYLQRLESTSRFADNGFEKLIQQCKERHFAKSPADLLAFPEANSLVSPSFEHMAQAFLRAELSLRLTRTSVSVKQFHLKYGRWPTELIELREYGIDPVDWSNVDGQPFGYKNSSDQAYVWGPEPYSDGKISSTIPQIKHRTDRWILEWQLTPIR